MPAFEETPAHMCPYYAFSNMIFHVVINRAVWEHKSAEKFLSPKKRSDSELKRVASNSRTYAGL